MSKTSDCCDHKALIRKQFIRIETLENEIALLRCERDSVIVENEKLQFQLQMMAEAFKQQQQFSGNQQQLASRQSSQEAVEKKQNSRRSSKSERSSKILTTTKAFDEGEVAENLSKDYVILANDDSNQQAALDLLLLESSSSCSSVSEMSGMANQETSMQMVRGNL